MNARLLDVRRLPPPEPLERILDSLSDLPPGTGLRVLHRREPFPLYDLLRRLGHAWESRWVGEDFELLIRASGDPADAARGGAAVAAIAAPDQPANASGTATARIEGGGDVGRH